MPTALKYALIFLLSATANGSFRLYNTKVSDNGDYKDCLYSFMLNSDKNEWQLIPYCIRHNVASNDDDGEQCYGNANFTFEHMKRKNVPSHHLYRRNAPIDTINHYQKYLAGDDFSLGSYRYCNCSADWFGARCQYSFAQSNGTETFDEIVWSQLEERISLENFYEILKNPSLLTCYEGLQCRSTICLDWRQICDGSFNCENGEDEPEECLLLETNECQKDEHRCRSGMCIPKTFLIDFDFDCMDLSDESETYYGWSTDDFCYRTPKLVCDFSLCDVNSFPCGDGQCVRLLSDEWHLFCNNGRDMFLRQNLLFKTLNDGTSSKNISSECWNLMMCVSDPKDKYSFNYATCDCSDQSMRTRHCLKSFQKHCPVSFVFEHVYSFLYPFVRLLYHNTPTYSSEWWLPTHFCYSQSHCPAFPFTGLPLIHGLMCIERENIPDWLGLTLLFFGCRFRHTSLLAADKRLFYCDRSMKFISKHRVSDDYFDCFYEEDEFIMQNATVMSNLNLTYHFKCAGTNEWFSRPLIGSGQCLDYSDTLHVGSCKIASDIGCQFLRNLYPPHVDYVFQENCNGIARSTFRGTNETDEANCEEWPWPTYGQCDGYWDASNGEDELNCPNTILSYITHTVFKCSVNEHYCAYSNRTMGCLSKERAGDGIVDCLGETDERTTSCAFLYPLHPFRCSNGDCISLAVICDRENDCSKRDDELICSWIPINSCKRGNFNCNEFCIPRTSQCDGIIDCPPSGQDEWFCDLRYRRIPQFSLDKIEKYPPVIVSPDVMITTVFHSPKSLPVQILLKSESIDFLEDWLCNRGIRVTKRSLIIECLCPPSYYGPRCQYQAERLLITIRVDTPATLSGH
ncbi:unnamed protein product [Rotaria socialis]|uniref:Uncharacterized protein n=2 Tax=Rotaria socialis TaxID=392032 RepID=A0A818HH26_9BILA|nr:unnamed protein product [Rotaria socialis]CAF4843772.1 unnamed protein product [Rotaria socialis]